VIFTCTELLETRRQIINIIFKSIYHKPAAHDACFPAGLLAF